jgi:hypothetical protein
MHLHCHASDFPLNRGQRMSLGNRGLSHHYAAASYAEVFVSENGHFVTLWHELQTIP